MSLRVVRDEETPSDALGRLVAKLQLVVDRALDGDAPDPSTVEAIAKLTQALARLHSSVHQAEKTVRHADLLELVQSMAGSINAHVPDRRARAKIQREWTELVESVG